MKGIIGKFFFQFGVTISVAVLISLLEALTLAPMRCSRMLEVGRAGGPARAVGQHHVRPPRRRLPAPAGAGAPPPQARARRRGRPLRALARHRQAAPAGVHPLAGHEPLRDPLPDPGGLEPRHHRPHLPPDRALPAVAARGRHVRRLRGRLRRRRGQQRLRLRDHEGPGRPAGGPEDREAALAAGAHGRRPAGDERASRAPGS